jgi:phage tail-like protein
MDADDPPLTVYNYKVEIDGIGVGFNEVSGLNIEYTTISYSESPVARGALGPRRINMPGQIEPPGKITLSKGSVGMGTFQTMYAWINSIQGTRVTKKDIYVRLCDGDGEAVMSWKVINAFPIALEAPKFEAGGKDVAIETMTLMADRIMIEAA